VPASLAGANKSSHLARRLVERRSVVPAAAGLTTPSGREHASSRATADARIRGMHKRVHPPGAPAASAGFTRLQKPGTAAVATPSVAAISVVLAAKRFQLAIRTALLVGASRCVATRAGRDPHSCSRGMGGGHGFATACVRKQSPTALSRVGSWLLP